MLKSQDILNGLQSIVDAYPVIAVIWHVVFYALIVVLLAKWRPSNRLLCVLLCLPLLSVAILAWISGNPFNGITFLVLTVLMLIFGLKAPAQAVSLPPIFYVVTGILMVVFGLVYPHFMDSSFIAYLYASPLGLIPCPTLSLLVGVALIFNGFGSRSVTLICIIYGLFYGVFGVLKLSVYVDLMLIFGSVVLLIKYIRSLIK